MINNEIHFACGVQHQKSYKVGKPNLNLHAVNSLNHHTPSPKPTNKSHSLSNFWNAVKPH